MLEVSIFFSAEQGTFEDGAFLRVFAPDSFDFGLLCSVRDLDRMLSAADVDAGKYFVMLSNAYRGDAPSAIFRDDWPDKPYWERALLARDDAPEYARLASPEY